MGKRYVWFSRLAVVVALLLSLAVVLVQLLALLNLVISHGAVKVALALSSLVWIAFAWEVWYGDTPYKSYRGLLAFLATGSVLSIFVSALTIPMAVFNLVLMSLFLFGFSNTFPEMWNPVPSRERGNKDS